MKDQDTITAIATPLGSGAVGMVRLSGADAIEIAQRCFQSLSGKSLRELSGYTGTLGRIMRGGEEVDEAIAFVYRAPKSYTGEEMVELCCHGGVFILREILEICVRAGARPAMPGEYTKRAFLNGKLNLTQAEAVCDLIGAHSEGARRAALAARDGVLSTAIDGLVERLTAQSAHLAAWADYPEEDLEPVQSSELLAELSSLNANIEHLIETYRQGRLLRDGIDTAIVGKPNVGKSSLMNLLSGAQSSIVAELPGTTRDIVQESVRMGDYLLRLMDTAGIRSTKDPVESRGVELAVSRLRSAQLVLAVFDSSLELDAEDYAVLEQLSDANTIAVINKTDLPPVLDTDAVADEISRIVYISAEHGTGREILEQEILSLLQLDALDTTAAILTNSRQHHAVLQAQASLREALSALEQGITLDAVNVCIDDALDHLLSVTGRRATGHVVDQVFARFCVGK